MSYYECVHALPEGSSSASRMALVARRLGYQGIIVANCNDSGNIFNFEAARKVRDIEVVRGADVLARDRKGLHNRVTSLRRRVPFLAVQGVSDMIVRAACEDPNVDVLIQHPEGRGNLGIAAARSAKQNQVAWGFDLSPMIRLRGGQRSRWMSIFRRNLVLARKFRIPMMITARPMSHLDLRAPREMIALAGLAGMEMAEARAALEYPGRLLELNRRTWVSPGVELI